MDVEKQYHYKDISSKYINLVYNSISFLRLSLWSPIEFIQKTYDGA